MLDVKNTLQNIIIMKIQNDILKFYKRFKNILNLRIYKNRRKQEYL